MPRIGEVVPGRKSQETGQPLKLGNGHYLVIWTLNWGGAEGQKRDGSETREKINP